MSPERLTIENFSRIESKNIYFVGFSAGNIEHFVECFPHFVSKICGIFAVLDIDERTPLEANVAEETYRVKELEGVVSLDRNNDVLVIMYEYEKEAYEKILSILGKNKIDIYWFPDKATEIELDYRKKYRDLKLEDIILFKSSSRQFVYGEDFNDNAKALFEHMINNGYNKRWKLVWLVYEPESKDYDVWKHYDNVEFIGVQDKEAEDTERKELYYRYLCSVKYAFVTDDESFFRRRRRDQILVQLWHGDGVKGRTRFRVMEKRFEYMVCTSCFFAEVDYKDFGLRRNQMLPCGLPKDDWVLSSDDDDKRFIKDNKGFDHYILWGPTFRKSVKGLEILDENVEINETGLPILNSWEVCNELNEKLKSLNCLLVVKLHPVANLSIYREIAYSNIKLMTNQDLYSMGLHINQIMLYFDAFITDYSSAATSYMILDRPMAFTLDDLDEYDSSRGFVLTPVRDYLPGKELYTAEDMTEFIEDVCEGRDKTADKRHLLCEKMIDYMDSNNSRRLLDSLSIIK